MEGNRINTGCTSGLGNMIFIVFLVLKLCKVIDWSWWWVTAPLWISAGIGLIILALWIWANWKRW